MSSFNTLIWKLRVRHFQHMLGYFWCFHNPSNSGMDYSNRIFNVRITISLTCLFSCVYEGPLFTFQPKDFRRVCTQNLTPEPVAFRGHFNQLLQMNGHLYHHRVFQRHIGWDTVASNTRGSDRMFENVLHSAVVLCQRNCNVKGPVTVSFKNGCLLEHVHSPRRLNLSHCQLDSLSC